MSFKIRFTEKLPFSVKTPFADKKKYPVGLDIGSSSLKAAELRPSGDGVYTLTACGFEELPSECTADGASTAQNSAARAINRIFANNHIRNDKVVASVSGHSVIVKKMSVHLRHEEDLAESIRREAERHLPFDINDVNFDFQITGESNADGILDILFTAVKKDGIQAYLDLFSRAKKSLTVLDVDAFALHNAYEFNYRPEGGSTAALLNIGDVKIMINFASGTDFLFTRDISAGGQRYTEFLQNEFNLNRDKAQALKRGETIEGIASTDVQYVIDSVTEIICTEIQKTVDFFKSTSDVKKIDKMLVSGGAVHIRGLFDALKSNFDTPVEKFDSFRKIRVDSKRFPAIKERTADMAIAVGLALRSERG